MVHPVPAHVPAPRAITPPRRAITPGRATLRRARTPSPRRVAAAAAIPHLNGIGIIRRRARPAHSPGSPVSPQQAAVPNRGGRRTHRYKRKH